MDRLHLMPALAKVADFFGDTGGQSAPCAPEATLSTSMPTIMPIRVVAVSCTVCYTLRLWHHCK